MSYSVFPPSSSHSMVGREFTTALYIRHPTPWRPKNTIAQQRGYWYDAQLGAAWAKHRYFGLADAVSGTA